MIWGFLFSALAYVWIAGHVPITALANAGFDDALFVRLGARIADGQWLGPYNHLTLVKGPFFPIWIAANWLLGCPLRISQAALYAAAVFCFTRAIASPERSPAALLAIFLGCLFNPANFSSENIRVLREGLYVPLTVLVAAGLAWHVRLCGLDLRRRAAFAAAMGLLIGLYWLTREEGILLLPAIAVSALFAARSLRQAGAPWRQLLMTQAQTAVIAAAAAGVIVGSAALINKRVYGVGLIVELKQEEFLAAYGALSRLEPAGRTRYVPVSRAALQKASQASPALAELLPFLKPGWSAPGCRILKIEPCDGEIRGGWFFAALRDAAADAGFYRDADFSRRYYRRLASELNAACQDGRLSCSAPRRTLAPIFEASRIGAVGNSFWRAARQLALFSGINMQPSPSAGEPYQYRFFRAVVKGRIFPLAPEAPEGGLALGFFRILWNIYRLVVAPAAIVSLLFYFLSLRRGSPDAASTILLVMILSRLLLLAYMDAASSPIITDVYLAPLYPLLLLFCGVQLGSQPHFSRKNRVTASLLAFIREK